MINFKFLRRKTSLVTSLVAKLGNNRFFVGNRIKNSNESFPNDILVAKAYYIDCYYIHLISLRNIRSTHLCHSQSVINRNKLAAHLIKKHVSKEYNLCIF